MRFEYSNARAGSDGSDCIRNQDSLANSEYPRPQVGLVTRHVGQPQEALLLGDLHLSERRVRAVAAGE